MRQRPLKRTRFKKALPALFCAGITVLLPLLTGCNKETPRLPNLQPQLPPLKTPHKHLPASGWRTVFRLRWSW